MHSVVRILSVGVIALCSVACLGACSSSSSSDAGAPPTSASDAGVEVACENDKRVDTYTANLVKHSASGALTITLVSSDPAPPARGTDAWIVRATDTSGAVIPAAELTVTPFMPDHGHGPSVKATLTDQPDGSISVTPLYLFMPGVWRVTFARATDAGAASATDSVEFFFCVAG